MDLNGTKTEKNLHSALTGESLARNRYSFYATHAKMCGMPEVAETFERLAINEMMHARAWFGYLFGSNETVGDDLKEAMRAEYSEWHTMYPTFAQEAREEGFEEIAAMFERVAAIERDHEMQFMALSATLPPEQKATAAEPAPKKEPEYRTFPGFRCRFCGAVYDKEPQVCGVCEAIGNFESCTYSKQVEG